MTYRSIYERLKEERKRLNFTQQEVAAIANVERETWSRYESGKISPGMEVLAAIAVAGADIQYIVLGTRSTAALTPDETELLEKYRSAPIAVKAAAIAALIGGSAPAKAPRYTVDFGNAKIGQSAAGDIVNKARKK